MELDQTMVLIQQLCRPVVWTHLHQAFLGKRSIGVRRDKADRCVTRRWWLSTHIARRRNVLKFTTAALVFTPQPSSS